MLFAMQGTMLQVPEGFKTWRNAGSDAAQFILTPLEFPSEEAQALAQHGHAGAARRYAVNSSLQKL